MEYYVSKSGCDSNIGSKELPFLTISKAAAVAEERDTVIVHEGVYRECVSLSRGARSESTRITFTAADGEKVVIKGSEVVKNWEKESDTVYKTVIDNNVFGEYNPFEQILWGDWFDRPKDDYRLHTGAVYLNGEPLQEVPSLELLKENCWYAKVGKNVTEIYACFGKTNPKDALVEINVRKSCFIADGIGVNYITIRGFEMAHAATTWSPPTSEQSGLVCANWCRGWIIENNYIHHSRCNGICIGKEKTTGHNIKTLYERKTGHLSQLEVVFAAKQLGWDKEHVGSHIIRNNTIHDCGQTGIVGHMGCAFIEIYGNHIYNICCTEEFIGAEVGGIKLHAAIDTHIHNNRIHDSFRGMWLDWQAQGTRISSNLLYNNASDDVFIEVCHGPHIVDNNLLLSKVSLINLSQGGAYIHNLFAGKVKWNAVLTRYTPYHYPHSTELKGVVTIPGGDDRYYNNIFAFMPETDESHLSDAVLYSRKDSEYGTERFDETPCTYDEYIKQCVEAGDVLRAELKAPVYVDGNSYVNAAPSSKRETNKSVSNCKASIEIVEQEGNVYLVTDIDGGAFTHKTAIVDSKKLGITVISEAEFENPDGSGIVIDKDYFGNARNDRPLSGPIEGLKAGKQKHLVWKKA